MFKDSFLTVFKHFSFYNINSLQPNAYSLKQIQNDKTRYHQ